MIGSAGGPEKVAYVRDELGFDVAFDYRTERLSEEIDVYFDNVGGPQLERPSQAAARRPDRPVRGGLAVQRDLSRRPARGTWR